MRKKPPVFFQGGRSVVFFFFVCFSGSRREGGGLGRNAVDDGDGEAWMMDVPPEQKATPISRGKGEEQVSFCFPLRFKVCLSVCLLRSPDSVVVGCRPGTGANSLCESDNHMVGILVVKSLESGHRGRLSGD